ncbi:hypothetical protein V6N13_128295 [Hibiscus sabdariffa]|uniref:Peptidase M10 metallopeptidase domain-containing protein n=1 Tax=Hibiscus sabdariffa TaxID=183260 RepID=A0ABR2P1G0_9ROSI
MQMAAKFRHQLLGAFLTILVLQPFVAGKGSYGRRVYIGLPKSGNTLTGVRWNNLPLTYGFLTNSSLPAYLDVQVVTSIIDAAFQIWQVAVPLFGFQRIYPGENANIKIAFTPLDSSDYGIGYYPPDGRLYLDNSYVSWSTKPNPASNELDLFSGVLSVIGNTLGLANSNNPSAVMYSGLTEGTVKRQLTQEDITRIQALY